MTQHRITVERNPKSRGLTFQGLDKFIVASIPTAMNVNAWLKELLLLEKTICSLDD